MNIKRNIIPALLLLLVASVIFIFVNILLRSDNDIEFTIARSIDDSKLDFYYMTEEQSGLKGIPKITRIKNETVLLQPVSGFLNYYDSSGHLTKQTKLPDYFENRIITGFDYAGEGNFLIISVTNKDLSLLFQSENVSDEDLKDAGLDPAEIVTQKLLLNDNSLVNIDTEPDFSLGRTIQDLDFKFINSNQFTTGESVYELNDTEVIEVDLFRPLNSEVIEYNDDKYYDILIKGKEAIVYWALDQNGGDTKSILDSLGIYYYTILHDKNGVEQQYTKVIDFNVDLEKKELILLFFNDEENTFKIKSIKIQS